MIHKLIDHFRDNALFDNNEPILLAVSGGIDSTVLVHLFRKLNFRFGLAHVNFELRGSDSEDDEHFVRELAKSCNVPCFITSVNALDFARERKISIQMAAREIRYAWLEQQRLSNGYHLIATAHHQDDVIETALLNILRGTGIHGLHGIASKSGKIIRPLLPFFKKDIIEYAEVHSIRYRQDMSNLKPDYERNRLRLEIIPAIENVYPEFASVFAGNIEKWSDADQLYIAYIIKLKRKLLKDNGNEVHVSIPAILRLPGPKTILYEIVRDYGFGTEQSNMIFMAFNSSPGKIFDSSTHRIIKDRNRLIITTIPAPNASAILIAEHDHEINHAYFNLKISIHDAAGFNIPDDSSISCINHDLLEFPLLLRKWKVGDYFYPLGMKKKKKISDYLIDRKVPLHRKDQVYVLQSGEKIACILKERIDERFRITLNTKRVYVLR